MCLFLYFSKYSPFLALTFRGVSNFWLSVLAGNHNFKSSSCLYPLEPDIFLSTNFSFVDRMSMHAMAVVISCNPMKSTALTFCGPRGVLLKGSTVDSSDGTGKDCTIVLAD